MLQLEECTKAKEKRDEEAGLVVRDIAKSKTNVMRIGPCIILIFE